MDTDPFSSNDAEEVAKNLMLAWAEAVRRQAERSREIRSKAARDFRSFDRGEDWSPSEDELAANYRAQWTEEHMLVWSAYQLERWRARLATEQGEPSPPENQTLKDARDALEHLDDASLGEWAAVSPADKGPKGRALRKLPNQELSLALGGDKLFDLLDAERLEAEALKIVTSIEDQLADRAAYEDEMRDR